MHRTNLYIGEGQWKKLQEEAYEKEWTIAQIIRKAIDGYFDKKDEKEKPEKATE